MPESVNGEGLRGAALGFFGKIPARGDFVQAGLPRSFIDPWDLWLQRVLAASRAELGDQWAPAWREAPIWRFALAPGWCGPDAVLGLWMPSVDRVGRYFPLTVALAAGATDGAGLIRQGGGFLAAAEAAGLAAVEADLGVGELAARIAAAAAAAPADPCVDPALWRPGGTLWWSEGGPRCPAAAFAGDALPDGAGFAAMVDARVPVRRRAAVEPQS